MSKYINFIKTAVLVSIIGLFINVQSASAVTVPTFPSCLNPQGTLKVSYSDGTHGVVGDTKTYTGYDAVYKLTDNTLVQCLCPKDGNGIQTNWMKAAGFSQSEINTLKNDGWVYIQNGSAWGLDNEPYLAKNIGYSCIGGAGGSNGSNNSSGSSDGQKAADILGLASTGNIASVYFYLISGIALLIIGFNLKTVFKRN